jgi:hypothetical protein
MGDAEAYPNKVEKLSGALVTQVREVLAQRIKVASIADPEGNQCGATQPTGELTPW